MKLNTEEEVEICLKGQQVFSHVHKASVKFWILWYEAPHWVSAARQFPRTSQGPVRMLEMNEGTALATV